MAINTLKGVEKIDGHQVMTNGDRPQNKDGSIAWDLFDKMRDVMPVCVDHEKDMISFKMMTKPVSEGGSGCQLTTLIKASLIMINSLNDKFPCRENAITITKLEEALLWQRHRTVNREARGVEGLNEA